MPGVETGRRTSAASAVVVPLASRAAVVDRVVLAREVPTMDVVDVADAVDRVAGSEDFRRAFGEACESRQHVRAVRSGP